jgi:hypothetical protein
MVLTKDIASRVLHRNLSELILLASQDKPLTQTLQQLASVLKNKNSREYRDNRGSNRKHFLFVL